MRVVPVVRREDLTSETGIRAEQTNVGLTSSMVIDVVIIRRIDVETWRVEDDGDDLKRVYEGLHKHDARSNDKFQD